MAQFIDRKKLLPESVLDDMKYQVAAQLNLIDEIALKGWPEMKTRDTGTIGGKLGGNMVKVLIRQVEEVMARGEI